VHVRVPDEQLYLISCMHAGRFRNDIVMHTSTAALCVLAAVLCAAAAVAQSPQPALTAADVRRIALASAPGGAGASSRLAAASSGMQQAKLLGIQINTVALKQYPTLAKVMRRSVVWELDDCCMRTACAIYPPGHGSAVSW
jgi:hypothetical protein